MTAFATGQSIDPFLAPPEAPVRSILPTVFSTPTLCGPCRVESSFTVQLEGKLYTFVMRDKISPEDPYLIWLKATAFSIARREVYRGVPAPRSVRDFMCKNQVA